MALNGGLTLVLPTGLINLLPYHPAKITHVFTAVELEK